MLKETKHDYQNCLVGNYYDKNCGATFNSWEEFKKEHYGFFDATKNNNFDDTYNYVFRYDIYKNNDDLYTLELCIMLQRKGVYNHLYIKNIDEKLLNTEIKEWLKKRHDYIKELWKEIDEI